MRREIGRLLLGFGSSPGASEREMTWGEGRVGREERGWEGSVVEGGGAAEQGERAPALGGWRVEGRRRVEGVTRVWQNPLPMI
jgi:hypothetical protein